MGGNSGIIILYSQLLIIPVNVLIGANNGKPHPNWSSFLVLVTNKKNGNAASQPCPNGGKTDGRKSARRGRVTLDLWQQSVSVTQWKSEWQ